MLLDESTEYYTIHESFPAFADFVTETVVVNCLVFNRNLF